ncbi:MULTISPECIES: hypothetical protein [Streptomyces]|uniref:Amidohydrolase n=1 Tax=Streptomyces eurythermus TaxID=42237 RepID=A0ABW6YTH6_9ACTN|nr:MULTISPECIES: hypothetical protein [Streptomyces]QIS68871.1 hypothetical protein HB370_01720 [Streptomyces sp. DSM 40868]
MLLSEAKMQPGAAHFAPGLAWLYAHPQAIEVARAALGTRDITFTGHSDAHQGFTLGGHKDSGSEALGDPLCVTHAGAMAPRPDSPEPDALRERISAFVIFGRGGERARLFSQANMRRQRRQLGLYEKEAVMAGDGGHAALLASQGVLVREES